MLLTIYDSNNIAKAQLSPDDSSTQQKELQGDNVMSLSFKLYEHIALDVNDYIDYEGERYWLQEQYLPKQISTVEWQYDVKFYGIESMIKRFLVIKQVDGENDPVFTLTAPPREHVAMIVSCINSGMGVSDWKVGTVDGTDNIVIDYQGKYCDEALKEIAEAVGGRAEWWCDSQTVNICRCEQGESIELGYNNGLTSIDPDKADNAKFYTRLFPIGSSRNIDSSKYGFSRLQLPDGAKFVEINTDKYGIYDYYEQSAFADIYPRRIGVVSSVRSETARDDDGNTYYIYYFKDDSLNFDPNDYEIGSLVKRVSFQEGSELAGLGSEDDGTYYFEVNYNSKTKEFEIITIWPYDDDTQLPGGTLIPKVGDKYILWNISMPTEYYALAEAEFLEAVNAYNDENAIDTTVYKSSTDHVWIENNNVGIYIGRRTRLVSSQYFPEAGYRDSRITKITRKVVLPGSMDIEISDALSTTSMQKMSNDISDIKSYVEQSSVSLPDIVKTGDKTKLTDNNLLSALRTLSEIAARALSKVSEDVAAELIRFAKGLTSDGIVRAKAGAEFGEFVKSLYAGKGAGVDAAGNAQVESLEVRSSMTVMELIINRLSALEGDQLLTEADTIERVDASEADRNIYQLYLKSKWDGYYTAQVEGNVLKGVINTLAKGSGTYQTCWMRVNSVNITENRIEVSLYGDEDVPSGKNYPPCELMKVARWGNAGAYTDRQSCLYFSSSEGRIVKLVHVTKPIIEKSNYGFTVGTLPEFLGELGLPIREGWDYMYTPGIITTDLITVNYQGQPVATYVDRGQWLIGGAYYCNARNEETGVFETSDVWYQGCKWRCAKTGTQTVPAWNNTDWAMIEGNPEFTVDFVEQESVFDPDNFNTTLTVVAKLYNIDVTDDVLDDDVVWTRYSEDVNGVERVNSDKAWGIRHAGAGKQISLTRDDVDFNGSDVPKVLRYTATVTLRDGMGNVTQTDSISLEL
jgi:hypothetical protein